MDPYRTNERAGTCPRCAGGLEPDGVADRLVCLAGCGEWYPREAIGKQIAWHELDRAPKAPPSPWPWSPASCPICREAMEVAYRGDVRFDRCGSHGVWLDAGEFERFRSSSV